MLVNMKFLTGKDVLPEIDLLGKAATIKRFKYSPLGSELRKQFSVGEKQYKRLDKVFESNKKEEDKIKNKRSCAKTNLVYNKDFLFYK